MANLDRLKERVPDHARDLRINLGAVTSSTALAPAQAWIVAVAAAWATRSPAVIDGIEREAALPPAALAAARGAAAIMGMNNVYYRFQHVMGETSEYAHLPARLRMQIIGNPGIERLDFELACLAVSAIAGCETCMRTHERSARERGATIEMIQDAVRIAAILTGVAVAIPSAAPPASPDR